MPAALLLIDVQRAIDDPSWGDDRNNPDAEQNMRRLLDAWRAREWPVVHVRHASLEPHSTYRRDQPGFAFKDEVLPLAHERIIEKQTNSAFIGTPLLDELRAAKITRVVIAGVITNNSIEATARMSGNLGFDTFVVADATATFGRFDYDGVWRTSQEVHALSLANLNGEYATILTTAELLAERGPMPTTLP